jgi:hypothetical protein
VALSALCLRRTGVPRSQTNNLSNAIHTQQAYYLSA